MLIFIGDTQSALLVSTSQWVEVKNVPLNICHNIMKSAKVKVCTLGREMAAEGNAKFFIIKAISMGMQ